MLRVVLKDGSVREFDASDYTDYDWRGSAFVVINGNRWIAIFNWEVVREVLLLG